MTLPTFLLGHATHPDAHLALALAAAQIEAQRHAQASGGSGSVAAPAAEGAGAADAPTLGWLYLSDHYAPQAEALLDDLRQRWPGVSWVGATGVGIAASGVEYFDEPALALMLCSLPREQFQVFSGTRPLAGFEARSALVHADPNTAELPELIHEMSKRTSAGYVFGGLASGRSRTLHIADAVLTGGLSGVAFSADVALLSRVTQGCQPVGPLRRVTGHERNVITTLDGEPALDCLLRDLQIEGTDLRAALPKLQQVLVGLNDLPADLPADAPADLPADATAPADPAPTRTGSAAAAVHAFDSPTRRSAAARSFGADTRVRHLVGLDPARRAVAIGEQVETGMQLAFCSRNVDAARRDLTRICAELREELEPDTLPEATAHALKLAMQVGAAPTGGLAGLLSRATAAAAASTAASPAPASSAPGLGADAAVAAAGTIAGAIYVSCAGRGGPHFGAPSAELAIIRHALGDVPLVGFFAAGEIAHRHLYGYTGVLTVFARSA